MRTKVVIVTLLTILTQASFLWAGTYRETVEKSFSMPSHGDVILENTNGQVTIEGWDKEEVWLEAIKEVKTSDRRRAEEFLEKIEIRIDHRDNLLKVETIHPRRNNGFWSSIFGNGTDMKVTYTLKVPHKINLEIQTVNGRVTISEVFGQHSFESTNGAIHVFDSGGSMQAKTTNGSIEAEMTEVAKEDDMSFRTTNGSIEVVFPENFQGRIEARTTNGRVKTDFPIEVRGEMSRRKLSGTINGGNGSRVRLTTTNGSIRILER